MAYHLSKRNRQKLAPFLKMLEEASKDVVFSVSSPAYFAQQLRNAFGTTHPHLRDKFSLRTTASQVVCTYTHLQITLDTFNIVENTVSIFEIAQAILEGNIPIKFLDVHIIPEDLSSLRELCAQKNLKLIYNHPILEITNG